MLLLKLQEAAVEGRRVGMRFAQTGVLDPLEVAVAAEAEAVVTLATQADAGGEADAALPEHQQHLTAYQ
jgi:hypothetical protein